MTIYYSKSTQGFYRSDIHKDKIPEDKIEVSEDLYESLLHGQTEGKSIEADAHGLPCLIDVPVPTAAQLVAANNQKVLSEINRIEKDLQPRAMRDALIYKDSSKLLELDRQIAILRAQLK